MQPRLFVSIVLCCLFELSRAKKPRLAHGSFANIEDFPYMAALWYNGQFHCSASILSTRWALTAAHCLENVPPVKTVHLTVGNSSIYHGKKHKIRQYHRHPEYDGLQFDIAMIKVKRAFKYNKLVLKITLDNLKMRDTLYDNCLVAGWGKIFRNGQSFWPQDGRLRFIDVKMISHTECKSIWKQWIKSFHICGTGDAYGSGPCDGDSGSPLVCDNVQVGIVSFARADCGKKKWYEAGAVFTRVSSFSRWIKDTAEL